MAERDENIPITMGSTINPLLNSSKGSKNTATPLAYTYAHAATSANTRKAYREDAFHFIAWGGMLPDNTP